MNIKQMIEKKRGLIETKIEKITDSVTALVSTVAGEEASQFVSPESVTKIKLAVGGLSMILDAVENKNEISEQTNS